MGGGSANSNTEATNNSLSSFPTIGEFEIGTFNAPTVQNGGISTSAAGPSYKNTGVFNSGGGDSGQFGGGTSSRFGQSQSGQPIAGPGIRETGIIEKLLVRMRKIPYFCNFRAH